MPTYEYVCEKCGHTFDKVESISAPSLTTCPEEVCPRKRWGKGKVKRAITAGGGLLFKGSGFYITDYRSYKYREAAKKDVAPTTASKPTGESKPAGDSKPSGGSKPTAEGKTPTKPAAKAGGGDKS